MVEGGEWAGSSLWPSQPAGECYKQVSSPAVFGAKLWPKWNFVESEGQESV